MQIFVVDIQLFSRKPDSLNLGLPINQRVFFFLVVSAERLWLLF